MIVYGSGERRLERWCCLLQEGRAPAAAGWIRAAREGASGSRNRERMDALGAQWPECPSASSRFKAPPACFVGSLESTHVRALELAPDAKPELAVAIHSRKLLRLQTARLALLNEPAERMPYHSRRVALVARADPVVAVIVLFRRPRR